MLWFLVLALAGVGLALLLDQLISRPLLKDNSARQQEQRAQMDQSGD